MNMDEEKRGSREMTRRERDPTIDDPEPTALGEIIKQWPKSTFCIIGNEFCERFSYYGMRTVLTLYLINILKFNNDNATILFHAFTVLAYTSPLFGSILADGYIGKFWTIFSISLVYAAGQIVLAVASTFSKDASVHPWLDLIGLAIIAIGTGGIKPCVSAFGGDQFKPHYLKMISMYFSIFYFMINAGSTISTFATPYMRAVPCLGNDSCYPLAFGIPAVLMIIATVFFMLGSFFYKKVPPKENVMARVARTILRAIARKFSSGSQPRAHWLEHALDGHDCAKDERCVALAVKGKAIGEKCAQVQFVDDIKSLVRVCVMMLPVPMFWALYDQQGSRWVIQAVEMDARITDSFSLLPDQMAVLNAILIMIFIPIFQVIIYPVFDKCGIRTTSLRRMAAGGLLAALAFVICGFVQLSVNKTLPDIPKNSQSFLSFVNAFPSNCDLTFSSPGLPTHLVRANSSLIDDKVNDHLQLYRVSPNSYVFNVNGTGANCPAPFQMNLKLSGGKSYYAVVSPQGWMYSEASLDKPQEGEGQFSINVNLLLPCASSLPAAVNWTTCAAGSGRYDGMFALCRQEKHMDLNHPCNPKDMDDKFYVWKSDDTKVVPVTAFTGAKAFDANVYDFDDVKPGVYRAYYVKFLAADSVSSHPSASQTLAVPVDDHSVFELTRMGGVYSWTITSNNANASTSMHTIVPENNVHILWQIPQYLVITMGEILFSITGLEFAYAEASPSMKSVVQAIWLFTVAIGDLIIIIIAELDMFDNLATEMFTYAGAMVVVIGVFVALAIFYYEYADFDGNSETAASLSDDASSVYEKRDSLAFDNHTFDERF